MSALIVKAVLAGVFFGVWPLLMNRSGLSGNVSAMVFALFALITVTPFAMNEGFSSIRTSLPVFFIAAGLTAGLGLISFNGMLSKATPQQVGSLFLIMLTVQVAVPALYHMYHNGIELRKSVGIVLVLAASYLLA